MYEAFYGLSKKPFSIIPDPAFLFLTAKHAMALDLLEYGLLNQAGFSVITGEIGTGKTTLIRHFLGKVERNVTVGLVSNTHRGFGHLLQWILFSFSLDWRGLDQVGMFERLVEFLIRQCADDLRTVLIIDEAQNMSPDMLEELRLLSNLNADRDQLIQIVLVGQAGLRETLKQPELAQFAQRIAVDYHLTPLEVAETRAYIRHRISVAAERERDLFDDAAHEVVFAVTKGIPRLINLLCDTALVYGYAEQKPFIDARIVQEVARDKKRSGALSLADDGPARQISVASTIERMAAKISRANPELTPDPIAPRDTAKGG